MATGQQMRGKYSLERSRELGRLVGKKTGRQDMRLLMSITNQYTQANGHFARGGPGPSQHHEGAARPPHAGDPRARHRAANEAAIRGKGFEVITEHVKDRMQEEATYMKVASQDEEISPHSQWATVQKGKKKTRRSTKRAVRSPKTMRKRKRTSKINI